ncbi:MAG TPA: SdpI family protein [Syntrophales bacterium]|nr:SdpI family protein [Syntrophales bacterium]
MESTGIILGISNIFVASLIVGVSIPLVMRKIPMNHIYGVRFKKSYESEDNWYKINNYGGKQLIIWSVPLFIIGILTFFLPLKENGVLTTLIACAPLIVLIPAYTSYKFSKKL